jgi:hypothetical protein
MQGGTEIVAAGHQIILESLFRVAREWGKDFPNPTNR